MDVAIITEEYPPYNNKGGVATFTGLLARLLSREGYRVLVFTDTHHILSRPATKNGVTIIPFINISDLKFIRSILPFIPRKVIISLLLKYFPTTSRLVYYNLIALFTFISYRKRYAIRIAHVPTQFAIGYIISLVFPHISHLTHAQGPDELLQPYDRITLDSILKAWIETRYMNNRSKYIVCCSRSVMSYLANKYHHIRGKLLYIPNFIETKSFSAPLKKLDTNTLMFIGRLEYRKGVDLVVQAFAELSRKYPKLKLIILGEDTDAWRIDGKQSVFLEYVAFLGLPKSIRRKISFAPQINQRSRLVSYLQKHRGIAILPSRYEPFGFVYIETMMVGYITIASTRGSGSEIIENGQDGFTTDPVVEEIIKTIQFIKNLSISALSRIAHRARRKITTTYDIQSVVHMYAKLYQRLAQDILITKK